MQTEQRVCGLMLAYFKADMTLACLQTLAGQGIGKMILVDNSSDPAENQHTLELAKHFPDGWLNVVIADENLGFAKGMNLAWKQARQLGEWDYFLILNNDMEAEPSLVKSLCEHMSEHPQTGMVTTTTQTPHGLHAETYYHRWTGLLFKKPVWGSFLFLGGHCLLIRSKAIEQELFNPRYFMYGEDIELNWRLTQQGWNLTVLPDVLLKHEGGGSSGNGSLFYEYHINRWHLLIVNTLGKSSYERFFMYLVRLPLLTARAAIRSWRFRRFTPLKALVMAGFMLPIRPITSYKGAHYAND